MLSSETEHYISRILMLLSNLQEQVDLNKNLLISDNEFDPISLFNYLDKEKKNCITVSDILNILRKNGIYSTPNEINNIFLFYDKDCDHVLNLREFLDFLNIANNYNDNSNINNISFNIEYYFIKILEKELNLIRVFKENLKILKGRFDYNVHEIFHLLKGFFHITEDSLFNVLKNNFNEITEKDIKNIFKRMDINKDGKIDFNEFHNIMCFPQINCFCCKCCNNCQGKNFIKFDEKSNLNFRDYPQNSFNKENINNNSQTFYNNYQNNLKNNSMNFEESTNIMSNNNTFKEDEKIKIAPNLALRNYPTRKFENYQNFVEPNSITSNKIKLCCSDCRKFPCECCYLKFTKGEESFLSFLKSLMLIELEIEKSKINLCLHSDFNVEDAFEIFLNNKIYSNDVDFNYGLNMLDIYTSYIDINLLMKRMNTKDKITFNNFFDLVVPFDKQYRDMMSNRKKVNFNSYSNKTDFLLFSTKKAFQDLIKLIIDSEKKIEEMKSDLDHVKREIKNIYKCIDKLDIGYFTDMDLISYLKLKNFYISQVEAGLLFIRLDKDKDGKVTLWDLVYELNLKLN